MNPIFSRLGKTGNSISLFLTIVVSLIACWQFFKSTTKHNLAGAWKLTFVNHSSSYKKYIGDVHTQKVFFHQNDCEVTGKGEKWEYNGEFLPYNMHRKLEYMGEIEADGLKATFKLFGLLRESSGIIDVKLTNNGKSMIGTFMGTAGDTEGIITGERID